MPPRRVAYSILDLSPIPAGATAATALRNTLDLARHAERWGYTRYWIAEHHNIPGVASAATAVVIGHVAGGTSRLRVGSGGIMLPNHAPLTIAEQFGTLESLYPGRIDLGLGRAPGGDAATARALRRGLRPAPVASGTPVTNATREAGGTLGGDPFADDVAELRSYFASARPGQAVAAIPGQGLRIPLYLLGSSDYGARLAAALGLPFAFASHFAPDYLHAALDLYRRGFRPSETLAEPYVMVGVNVFAADTDDEARELFTSLQGAFLNLIRGRPREIPPPVSPAELDARWSPDEKAYVARMTRVSAVGGPATLRRQLEAILEETRADEVIATAQVFDHAARLRSFEIAAGVFEEIHAGPGGADSKSRI